MSSMPAEVGSLGQDFSGIEQETVKGIVDNTIKLLDAFQRNPQLALCHELSFSTLVDSIKITISLEKKLTSRGASGFKA